jgi:uncharacterized protein
MRHCDKLAVTVNPTNACNLRCIYCMASSGLEQESPITIDMDFAERGIRDALAGHPTGVAARVLRFFSPGEATQRMDVIRECVGLARSIEPGLPVELQTNGLLTTPEDVAFVRDRIDVVWFSLDGPPKINDVQRPDATGRGRTRDIEAVMAEIMTRATVGVRATVGAAWFDRQVEMVEYYHGLGLEELAINPVIQPIRRRDQGRAPVDRDDVMTFCRGFVPAYRRARGLGMRLTNSLAFNFDEPTRVACRSLVPMPQLNPDGSVSSCDMALYGDTKAELDCFLYGRWDAEQQEIVYDGDKIVRLQRRDLDGLAACQDCAVREYCAGGCAGRTAFQTGDIFTPIPEYCAATRYLARHMELGGRSWRVTHP